MAGERIQKPTLGARFDPTHPQAAGLRHAWLLNEASGRVVNDAVAGRLGSIEAGALWTPRGVEAGVDVVSASAQYVDMGVIPALEGATRFTMIARMYRASASNFCEVQRGTASTSRVGIHLYTDGRVYFTQCASSSLEHGSFAASLIETHTLASVFDGTQATNAARLKGYLDGVQQTLTYGTTIPAATSAPNATLRLGQCQDGGPRSSTGSFYFVFIYDRALEEHEIAAISRDPYAPWIGAAAATRSTSAAGSSAEVTVADITVEADDLVATSGQFVVSPEADVTLEADALLAVAGEVDVECPPAEITVTALALIVETSEIWAEFSRVSPEPEAWAYRGPDFVSVDVTSSVPSDPVDEASIGISVDGVALAVSTVSIAGGFRATAPKRWHDEQTYAVTIAAKTTTGPLTTLAYEFTAALWIAEAAAAAGFVNGALVGHAVANGSCLAIQPGYAAVNGSCLPVGDGTLRLDGSVGAALDLIRTGEVVILQGWVTVYISETLLFVSIQVGDPTAQVVDVGGEAWNTVAAEIGGETALDVYAVAGHYGIDQAVEVRQPVTHLVDVAIQAGEATAAAVDVAIELEGYAASGTIVLDSPSAEWAAEEEAETG